MSDGERRLEDAGLSELEESIYIALLSQRGLSSSDIADQKRISDRRARATLRSLEDKGLVSRSASRPPRYMPSAPSVAITRLLTQRRESLERTLLAVESLNNLYVSGAAVDPPARDLVQLIDGYAAIQQRIGQVLAEARQEVLGLGKAPLRVPPPDYTEFKLELLRSGVRCRTVYELAALDSLPAFLRRVAPAGEESRVLPLLPMRLLIVDRRIGLTPLHTDRWDQWLLVTSPPLLAAFVIVFEDIWAHATPIMSPSSLEDGTATAIPGAELSADMQRVLLLLFSGLRDRAIADHLGMTVKAVERNVNRLMDKLGAHTRFEAGAMASEAGLRRAPIRSERERMRTQGGPAASSADTSRVTGRPG